MASEAARAIDTLKIMVPELAADGARATLPQLHPSQSNAPDCEKMFDTMGYGPLSKFWADTATGVDGAAAYQQYADDTAPLLLKHLQTASRSAAAKAGADTVIAGLGCIFALYCCSSILYRNC